MERNTSQEFLREHGLNKKLDRLLKSLTKQQVPWRNREDSLFFLCRGGDDHQDFIYWVVYCYLYISLPLLHIIAIIAIIAIVVLVKQNAI
jgi:hypothetical protein